MPTSSSRPPDDAALWRVPHAVNPFFTGRSKALHDVREALAQEHLVVLNAPPHPTETAGIGKTQTAVAYAHRFREEYEAVLWLRADDACTLIEDSLAVLRGFGATLGKGRRWSEATAALRSWLETNRRWLLILDNVGQSELLTAALPERPSGHVLAVSCRQPTPPFGAGRSVSLGALTQEEALRFLFKRTQRVDNDPVERKAAVEVIALLGGIPLAVELAGAFLSATQLRFREYLRMLRARLEQPQEAPAARDARRNAVALTALLSWEQVCQESARAAECLFAGAMLGRELLSLDLVRQVGEEDRMRNQDHAGEMPCGPLVRFGLIRPTPDPVTYVMHPSIREMVAGILSRGDTATWAARAKCAIERVCLSDSPSPLESMTALPWLSAAAHLARGRLLRAVEHAEFFERLARRADPVGGFAVTEPLLVEALAAREAAPEVSHAKVAELADELARQYVVANQRAHADQYVTRSLAAREQVSGPTHPDVAAYLDLLGRRYDEQGRHAQADDYFRRSLAIREQHVGKRHAEVASYLHLLGCRFAELSRQAEADQCFQKALATQEDVYGPAHPAVASYVHDLACRLSEEGRFGEAEPLFERAVGIARSALSPGDPELGVYLRSAGRFYHTTNRPRQAELLYKQALVHAEHMPRSELAAALNDLGSLYHQGGKYAKAEPLLEQALALAKKSLPIDHPNVAICSNNLAALYFARRRYAEADPLYQQALAIRRRHLPPDHPDLLTTLENYVLLLRKLGRAEEAAALAARVEDIRARLAPAQAPA